MLNPQIITNTDLLLLDSQGNSYDLVGTAHPTNLPN